MFEPNRFVHGNPNEVNFFHNMKTFPGIALLLQYVIRDCVMTSHVTFHWFTWIGSHVRAKNKFCMLEHNTFVYSNPNRVNFSHEMKMFSLMTLLLYHVIRDGVATSHVIFLWFIWIGSHFRAKNRNSLCCSTTCLCTATPTEWFFLRKCKCFL